MIIISVERNRQLRSHQNQTHAELVLPSQAPREGSLQKIWKEYALHDSDGNVGAKREEAGKITIVQVEGPLTIAELKLTTVTACGFRTHDAITEYWFSRHPRSATCSVVWFALGDWRDRDRYLAWTGRRAGADERGYCVDEQTEALTKRGWLRYDEILNDDELLGYDIKSHSTQWETHEGIYVFPSQEREMIAIESRSGTIVSTPDHRWPVLAWRKQALPLDCPHCGNRLHGMGYTRHVRVCERNYRIAQRVATGCSAQAVAEEFEVSHQIVQRAVRCYRKLADNASREAVLRKHPTWPIRGEVREERTTQTLTRSRLINSAPCATLPTDPTYEDAFVELVAWWCTEGCHTSKHRITLYQSLKANEPYVRDIERALNTYASGDWRWGAVNKNRPYSASFRLGEKTTKAILEVAPGKVMRPEFILSLTLEQLHLLWRVWIQADGHMESVAQASRERLEPLQMVLVLMGVGSTLRYRQLAPNTSGRASADSWTLTLLKQRTIDQKSHTHKRIVHEGIVWCPSTPSTYWVARREGRVFVTGNTVSRRRAMDADAPVPDEIVEGYATVNRQKDEARRAVASLTLASQTPSERLLRILKYIEHVRDSKGEEAARALYLSIRPHLRVILQRTRRAEGRKD